MFRFVVLVVSLATAVVADDVARQCIHNAGALPSSFQVEGCASAPCAISQFEDAVINVKFIAPRDSKFLRTELVVYLSLGPMTVPVPFDLSAGSQACTGLTNASCPVKEGQELEYTLKLPMAPFPLPGGLLASVEVKVVDDDNSPAFCASLPFLIVAPSSGDTVQVTN